MGGFAFIAKRLVTDRNQERRGELFSRDFSIFWIIGDVFEPKMEPNWIQFDIKNCNFLSIFFGAFSEKVPGAILSERGGQMGLFFGAFCELKAETQKGCRNCCDSLEN